MRNSLALSLQNTRVLCLKVCKSPLTRIGQPEAVCQSPVKSYGAGTLPTYLVIFTSLSKLARPSMALGVISMYCRLIELRAAEICNVSMTAALGPRPRIYTLPACLC